MKKCIGMLFVVKFDVEMSMKELLETDGGPDPSHKRYKKEFEKGFAVLVTVWNSIENTWCLHVFSFTAETSQILKENVITIQELILKEEETVLVCYYLGEVHKLYEEINLPSANRYVPIKKKVDVITGGNLTMFATNYDFPIKGGKVFRDSNAFEWLDDISKIEDKLPDFNWVVFDILLNARNIV